MDSIHYLQVTIGFIPIPNPVKHEDLLQFAFKIIFLLHKWKSYYLLCEY